jgi:uncharacterized membrane protein
MSNRPRRHAKGLVPNPRTAVPGLSNETSSQSRKDGSLATRMEAYHFEHFVGPIPSPKILDEYNRIIPGSAKQIFDNFIAQSDHRRNLESRVISSDIVKSYIGLVIGGLIGIGTLVLSYAAISAGQSLEGLGYVLAGLSSLVGTYVYGTHSRKREREEKEKIRAEQEHSIHNEPGRSSGQSEIEFDG